MFDKLVLQAVSFCLLFGKPEADSLFCFRVHFQLLDQAPGNDRIMPVTQQILESLEFLQHRFGRFTQQRTGKADQIAKILGCEAQPVHDRLGYNCLAIRRLSSDNTVKNGQRRCSSPEHDWQAIGQPVEADRAAITDRDRQHPYCSVCDRQCGHFAPQFLLAVFTAQFTAKRSVFPVPSPAKLRKQRPCIDRLLSGQETLSLI